MKFHVAISPCPNDTFMFYKFLRENDSFGVEFLDIEQLNKGLLECKFDLAKCSIAVLPEIISNYALLPAGMAVGFGNGPLLVAREKNISLHGTTTIAIPGKNTTAFALLKKFFPGLKNFHEVVFSAIPQMVANNEVDAGLIIHESRFTYERLGLVRLYDLGNLWEKETGLPLPLGGIVIKRNLVPDFARKWTDELRLSIRYAFEHMEEVLSFSRQYASEMEEEIMRSHIQLYVNQFSIDPGSEGRLAVERFVSLFLKDNVFLSDIWAL